MKFSIKDFFSKCDQFDFFTFTEEILNRKLHFLSSAYCLNCTYRYIRARKTNYTIIPRAFFNTFEEIDHKYPTRFPKYNFKQTPAFIN